MAYFSEALPYANINICLEQELLPLPKQSAKHNSGRFWALAGERCPYDSLTQVPYTENKNHILYSEYIPLLCPNTQNRPILKFSRVAVPDEKRNAALVTGKIGLAPK